MTQSFDPILAARVLLDVRRGGARPHGSPVTPPAVADAYAVQAEVMRQLGGRPCWKVAMLGGRVRQTAAMPVAEIAANGASLPPMAPDAAIEVETALILGADLPAGSTPAAALDTVAEVRLAFEMVSSRYADRASVPPLAAMADNFSSAGIVMGDVVPDWRDALSRPMGLTLCLDGQQIAATEQTPTLSDTADFLVWLADHAASRDMSLAAGDVIITGARIGPIPLNGARQALAYIGTVQVQVGLSYSA